MEQEIREALTRETILAMQPGRELDANIALRVMGVKEVTVVGKHYFIDPLDKLLPLYSTDIGAAWEVVEKFPIVNISRVEVLEKFQHHAVEIYTDMENNDPSRVEAPTAPEAICKAALLTVLEDKSHD